MSARDSNAEIFDVFLCHNSEDKRAVREIAQKLVNEGIKPWWMKSKSDLEPRGKRR